MVTHFPSAHAEQKRSWPHGTNATRSRGNSSQTSHISVAGDVADIDVDVDVDVPTPHLWTGDCQFYLLRVIFDIYRSPVYMYCGLELVSVTRASMWNLIFVFQVLDFPVLQFPVSHFPVLHFPPLHFWSCIFQYCILVSQTCHHWSRIFSVPSFPPIDNIWAMMVVWR